MIDMSNFKLSAVDYDGNIVELSYEPIHASITTQTLGSGCIIGLKALQQLGLSLLDVFSMKAQIKNQQTEIDSLKRRIEKLEQQIEKLEQQILST